MSIIPHHIQSQYYREVCDAQERGITVEELRAERKQKQAELDQMREDNATVLKGVAKMAELALQGYKFEFRESDLAEFLEDHKGHFMIWFLGPGQFQTKASPSKGIEGKDPAECFAKFLEHFK